MDKYGLIGNPVKGSKSPQLFGAAYGLPYDLIEESDFGKAWDRFVREYKAVNVTAPFKEQAYAKVLALAREGKGSVSGPAAKIGAANLLVKTGAGIEARNSDFTGIILSVAEAYYPGITSEFLREYGEHFHVKVHQYFRKMIPQAFPRQPQALIVGCGGAGRAAAVAAAELGFATVLMNRTQAKAQALAREFPEYGFLTDPVTDFKEAVKECELIVYTLPMKLPGIEALSADDLAAGEGVGKVILEANYKHPSFDETEQIKLRAAECRYVSGERWLLGQALTGYALMTGIPPGLPALEEALR